LYVLGISSSLDHNGVLTIDWGTLAANGKPLKITGLPVLLFKLRDYGFEVSDFGKSPKAGEALYLSFADNRYLTAALKAMADALFELTKGDLRNPKNDYFYMLHPALLEYETVKEPKLNIDSVINAISQTQHGFAHAFHEIVKDYTKHNIRIGQLMRNEWACTYTSKKNKRVLMSLKINQDCLYVKLNLLNINKYMSMVANMPIRIQNAIKNSGWECGECNPCCNGGIAFEMDGESHNKCSHGSFVFHDLNEDNLKYYKQLLEKEMLVA